MTPDEPDECGGDYQHGDHGSHREAGVEAKELEYAAIQPEQLREDAAKGKHN